MTKDEFQDDLADLINAAMESELEATFIAGTLYFTLNVFSQGVTRQSIEAVFADSQTKQ